MRKLVSILMSCLLTAGLAIGCAGHDGGTNKNVITIWHDKEDVVAEILQKKLDELSPDIKVVLEKKSDLTEALKMAGSNPKAAPDMYFFAHDKLGVYAEMGLLAPIKQFIPEEKLTEYLPQTIEAGTYKGELYQLPVYFETLLYMYNRSYMKDENVPKTTEELYTYMKAHTNGGHYGFVEQHSTPYYVAGWINGFGGSLLNEKGEPQLNSTQVEEALTYHKKFVEFMPGETEYATVNALFGEGMAHSTIGGPWMIPAIREKGIDVGVADMPVIDQTGKQISPYMGVQGIHVLKIAAEKKKDAVQQILEKMMDPKLAVELAKATGCAPAITSCYDMDEVRNDDIVMAMKKTADHAVAMPNLPEMDVMWTVTGNLLTDINMGNQDVKTSADKAQTEAEKLIKNMK